MSHFYCERIIDISLPLSETTPLYPGNPSIELETFTSGATGSILTKISFGSHTGTHIDAPRHIYPKNPGIDEVPLNVLVGLCKVVDLTKCGKVIDQKDLKRLEIEKNERILVKTKNSIRGFGAFYDDYIYLSGNAAEYLAQLGIMLFGIDALSVKQRGSKDNTPHIALLERNIPIIEGLNLEHVEEGEYFLVILPLKFIGLDASPARAVLLQ